MPTKQSSNRRGQWVILEAEFAALSQQVTSLEGDYRDLKVGVVNLDRKMEAGFASINAKIDSRNITPWASIWAALGVLLAGMTTVGWLALRPISESIVNLDAAQLREFDRRRLANQHLDARIDDMKSQLDWTDGWLAGRFDFYPKFAPSRLGSEAGPRALPP